MYMNMIVLYSPMSIEALKDRDDPVIEQAIRWLGGKPINKRVGKVEGLSLTLNNYDPKVAEELRASKRTNRITAPVVVFLSGLVRSS